MTREAARLRIEGQVQGVGFRWWAVSEARRLGVEGWARNRADGSVEILALGTAAAIAALQRACRIGPAAAQVLDVSREPAMDDGSHGFQQRETL
jgi:acylphosphatase